MSNLAVKLERLAIHEISGVDDPANCVPGWLVMNAEDAKGGKLEIETFTIDGKGFWVMEKSWLDELRERTATSGSPHTTRSCSKASASASDGRS